MAYEMLTIDQVIMLLNDGRVVPDCEVPRSLRNKVVYVVTMNIPGYMPDEPGSVFRYKSEAMRAGKALHESNVEYAEDMGAPNPYVVTWSTETIGTLIS